MTGFIWLLKRDGTLINRETGDVLAEDLTPLSAGLQAHHNALQRAFDLVAAQDPGGIVILEEEELNPPV